MKAADLKEAEQIVASLKWIERARRFQLQPNGDVPQLKLYIPALSASYRDTVEAFSMGRDAEAAAFAIWRTNLDVRETALRRRAAQISLSL